MSPGPLTIEKQRRPPVGGLSRIVTWHPSVGAPGNILAVSR